MALLLLPLQVYLSASDIPLVEGASAAGGTGPIDRTMDDLHLMNNQTHPPQLMDENHELRPSPTVSVLLMSEHSLG